MKTRKIYSYTIILLICSQILVGCTKDIIDKKPDKSQVVPSTIADLQALLDNKNQFSKSNIGEAEVGAGDFYLDYTTFQALTYLPDKASYNWQKDIWQGTTVIPEWDNSYSQVFYTNVALDGLKLISANTGNQSAYNNVKGMALYLRAEAFYNVAQMFAKPYDPATAATDLGIPLRLSSDLNIKSTRSTVQQTYDQTISDLTQALQLLPAITTSQERPAQAAAHALLARVYLSMGNYTSALENATASLKLYSTLVDYNSLDTTAMFPVPHLNMEVVYDVTMSRKTTWEYSRGKIDPALYQSYNLNDLRRSVFFETNTDGTVGFTGSYTGSLPLFSGITTDEQYLISAECKARQGQTVSAMADLNTLLKNRFITGTFVPYAAANADDALQKILMERRKELLFRGIRWSDLRRLNKDPRFAVTLTRLLNGVTYTLPPNDPRYVFPIPDYVISATGMQQNPR